MSANFSFHVEPERDLVRITMGGLFGPDDIQGFLAARVLAHAQLVCPRNAHLTLTDLREMKIQPQEMVGAFQGVLGTPEYRSRKLAFVIGRTLARSQLLRALSGRGAYCFDTFAEAEAWLFSESDEAPLRVAS
ncbi:hypothetical protein LQ953_11125 [Sphingomonas sp. IC-56]|uniref:hypothetical protein n=1 Tax=Sphingomonas sp. IC-56 TaxID=2898529 RepID=UPI001E5E7B34|nr:hypothetical protein [Sphingomonas sp. IC-56]MCD2324566.1 hypothetical protein [Sphingomonas sp. IC-56]